MRHPSLITGSIALASMSIAASFVAAASGDWPQWRGPNRDAISTETGLLSEWGSEGPPLAWKCAGLGTGYSSISIAGGKIFTMGDRAGQQYLVALDLKNGRELWATAVGKPWGDGGPRSTPTVDGNLVYAVTPAGDLVCLDANSGKGVWTKNFVKDFQGKLPQWAFCESPLVDGPNLICTPGGPQAAIVSLNKKTGKLNWQCPAPSIGNQGSEGAGYSSIVVSEAAGVKQYVQLMGRGVVGVAAKDGKFLWGYNRVANGTANIPTPLINGNQVFCSSGYGAGAALLEIKKKGANLEAEEVYFLRGDTFQNHHGGMVLSNGYVYCGHGHNNGFPMCLELKTGKVMWNPGRGPGTGSAAIVQADGHLYFRYENGLMALVEASPEGYRQKGSFKIPDSQGPSWPHPVVAGGKLYLREQDNLLCYSLKASP